MQLRQMEIVTDKDKLTVDIQATCMRYKTIKQWAYILHDKDDTRPHYHIYLNFGNSSADTAMVGGWFGVADNFVHKIQGRKTDMLQYLIHANESQKQKHQYSPSEVVSNFDFMTEIALSKIVGDFKHYSYAQQVQYCNSLPIADKAKAFTQLKKLWELECQCASLITDRKLDVVFICGGGGVGKTYYAKKMLTSMELDFCVSSSSNDPFQDYMGQKAMILDDLRDRSFELEDILKILDNNTKSSVKSRFNNKVFNGEMIVITSSVPLVYWYSAYKNNSYDNLKQLYRRITCYIEITSTEIRVYNEGVNDYGKPTGNAAIFVNELSQLRKETSATRDMVSVFGKICDTSNSPFDTTTTKKE